MGMNFGPEKAIPTPTIKEALEAAKVEGARVEQAGVSKTREVFGKVLDSAKKLASSVHEGALVAVGMTQKESRKLVAEAIQGEIDGAVDRAVDKVWDIGEDMEARKFQIIDGARKAWERFDQEHLVPLNNNFEKVIDIITTTVRELPGYAAGQAEQAVNHYTEMANQFAQEKAQELENLVKDAVASVNSGFEARVADFDEWKAGRAGKRADTIFAKAQEQYERYLSASEKVDQLSFRAQEHRLKAQRCNGGLWGAATRIRVKSVEMASVAD